MGDEKLTSREDQIGLLFLYIQIDENTLPKVDKIEQISIADLISEAIIRSHEKRPLSPLFEMGHK